MTIYLSLAFLLLGLLIGSFLNVVAIRVLRRESIAFPPSHCMACGHRLGAADLVPVLSYVALGGRCRYCRAPISRRYPAGELATGLLYALSFLAVGWRPELVASLLLASLLVVVTQTDLESRLIPDVVVLAGLAGAAAVRIWTRGEPWWSYAGGFFLGSGILLLLGVAAEKLLKREAIGGGDIKLYAFIGLLLGLKLTALSLFAASLAGLVYGLIVRNRGGELPFGPFIAIGTLAAYWWGDALWGWYIGLI